MNKLIAVALLVILVTGLLFTGGCTGDTTPGGTTITNDAQASGAVSDLGSDVSGIGETLDGIDDELG